MSEDLFRQYAKQTQQDIVACLDNDAGHRLLQSLMKMAGMTGRVACNEPNTLLVQEGMRSIINFLVQGVNSDPEFTWTMIEKMHETQRQRQKDLTEMIDE